MCQIIEDMLKEEREEARKEAQEEIAKDMLLDGVLPLEKIAQYTELSFDEVKNLQAEQGV